MAPPFQAFAFTSAMPMQRYLCIGEAPDISSQAFQQRSRWSKGHFQTFWSSECPLFDERLSIFHRLAFSSTCIGYLSTGLAVPVLALVPILTILFGWFPIALNVLTVLGITVYYSCLNLMSFYCHSWSHYKV
jgi:cellulose synthase/poly-beta-1,6-N-acetylglucosamine synthase-like glycosyltransferase